MAGMTFSVLMSGEKCLSIPLFISAFFSCLLTLPLGGILEIYGPTRPALVKLNRYGATRPKSD